MNSLLRKGGEMITACFSWKKIAERLIEVKEKANGNQWISPFSGHPFSKESVQSLEAYFGSISGAGITMRYKRMFERASRSRRLKDRVKKIRTQIVNI